MRFTYTEIPDIIIIEPEIIIDHRGFFAETFQEKKYLDGGIKTRFVQENLSGSKKGVLRGLHYQIKHAQDKLIQVTKGLIYDVAVDLRLGSPTFGHWVGAKLSSEKRNQIWIPKGFAHGFLTLSDWAEVHYSVTDYYAPEWERTILWNDPDIGIVWPLDLGTTPIVSTKDQAGKLFRNADVYENG